MQLASGKSIWILGCVLLGLLIGNQTSQASECKKISTKLDGSTFPCAESPGGLCANGTIRSGILKGTKLAVYTAAAPSAGLPGVESPFVLSYTADAVFTTKHGELHLSQLGVSDPFQQVFTELNRVVGGTGRFYQASGILFISGTLSVDGTEFESDITGTLCLTDSN
ncbi:MAG: dirigent protein [Deltaproteobacteria bacterium]|nr:dirigent protein [Deltaproteobacteria bacterium]